MKKALFLDRDGVINKEKNYLYKIEDFEFIDGVFETLKHFYDLGYLIVIITNQAGIARGKYSEEDFFILTRWMKERFSEKGILVDVYYCPHHPDISGICTCRKPSPGMILSATKKYNIDLKKSILVGDKESDIEAGINAGVGKNVLVRSGHKVFEDRTQANEVLDSVKDLR